MGWRCCIPHCLSSNSELKHKFPADPQLAQKWLEALNVPALHKLSMDEVQKKRVCARHFPTTAYRMTMSRPRLVSNAVPSCNLHLEDFLSPEDLSSIVESSTSQLSDESSLIIDNVLQTSKAPDSLVTVQHSSLPVEQTDLLVKKVLSLPIGENASTKEALSCKAGLSNDHSYHIKPSLPKPTHRSLLPAGKRKLNLISTERSINLKATKMRKHELALKRRLRQISNKDTSSPSDVELPDIAKKTFQIQSKCNVNRNPTISYLGRKYTIDDEVICLLLYKQSPMTYNYMCKIFTMPYINTLKTVLGKIPTKPGLNHILLRHLKNQANSMEDPRDRKCVLIWDEMSLSPHLDYDVTIDKVVGFEDWGIRRTFKFADHCLVFMLRGLHTGWKIPLAYNFCYTQTGTDQLKRTIKAITKGVAKTGLEIVATVCDQASSNVAALRELKLESLISSNVKSNIDGTIILHGQHIVPIMDPPQLLKGIANNLLTKDLEVDVGKQSTRKFASWDVLETAYKIDVHADFPKRHMPHLTEEHIVPAKIKKMRVKHAAQVFSSSVSQFIEFASIMNGPIETRIGLLEIPNEEGQVTAGVVGFFNDLFDSVNGIRRNSKSSLQTAITNTSEHHEFWLKARKQLRHMRFVQKTNKRFTPHAVILKRWIQTLSGMATVWKRLSNEGFQSLDARYLNQEVLEKFFGQIRSHGYRNVNPTCYGFQSSFKTLLNNNLTSRHSPGANCKFDQSGRLLFCLDAFTKLAEEFDCTAEASFSSENDDDKHPVMVEQEEQKAMARGSYGNSRGNTVLGIVLRHDMLKTCSFCKHSLMAVAMDLEKHCCNAETILHAHMAQECFRRNLKSRLTPFLRGYFEFKCCDEHHERIETFLIETTIIQYVKKWCERINNILTGKITDIEQTYFEIQAASKFMKRNRKSRRCEGKKSH